MATTQPDSLAPSPAEVRNLGLRRLVLVLWAIGFVPLFAALRSLLHASPLYRSLMGTGLFCVTSRKAAKSSAGVGCSKNSSFPSSARETSTAVFTLYP